MHKILFSRVNLIIIINCFCSLVTFGQDSTDDFNAQFNRMDRSAIFLPTTFTGNPTIGSPWYSPKWVSGQVSFNNGQNLPLPGEILYINYDKSANRVYFKKNDSLIAIRGLDIAEFHLEDSLGIHNFTRVARISTSIFLEVLIEPGNGLALYKRFFSKLRAPDYMDVGYTATGSKSPRYIDEVEYYLMQADKKSYSHFFLSNSGVRQKLSHMSSDAKKFMENHPGPVNEKLVITFCGAMNEKSETP